MNEQETVTKKETGNKTLVTVIIVVVAILVVLSIAGYFVSKFLAQKAANALIGAATGGKVTTQGDDSASLNLGDMSVKTGSLAAWPTDLPIVLQQPELTTLKSTSKIASDRTWLMTISDIPTNAIDNYISDLQDKGWTKVSDDNVFARIIVMSKDAWKFSIVYDEPNRGAQLTLSPK
jgi:hypothetical protein